MSKIVSVDEFHSIVIPKEIISLQTEYTTNICYEIKIGRKGIRLILSGEVPPIDEYEGGGDGYNYLTLTDGENQEIPKCYIQMMDWQVGKKFEVQVSSNQIRLNAVEED